MKKFLSILAIAAFAAGLFVSCAKINDRLDDNEADIARIKEAIGEYTLLKADITSVIQTLTAELGTKPADEQETVWACISTLKQQNATFDNAIKTLQSLVGDKSVSEQLNDLVSAYQLEGLAASVAAIKEIVEGKGDVPSLAAQIAQLKEKTDAIDGILARLSALETMIQSVTIMPAYDNGSVKVDDDILDIKVKVSPASSIKDLSQSQLEKAITIYVNSVEVVTKAGTGNYAKIDFIEASFVNKDEGIIAVRADVFEYLPEDNNHTITVAVNIKNGISDHTSEFMTINVVHPVAPEGFVYLGTRDDKGEHIYWAKCNLGAEKPEDAGNYYAWGSVEKVYTMNDDKTIVFQASNPDPSRYTGGWNPEERFADCNAPFFNGSTFTKYTSSSTLEPVDDAATKANDTWRIPSNYEFKDLGENCVWWWTTDYNGQSGYIVYKAKKFQDKGKGFIIINGICNWLIWDGTSSFIFKGASKPVATYDYHLDAHIFLPVTGHAGNSGISFITSLFYWSNTGGPGTAKLLSTYPDEGITICGDIDRSLGATVRPVCSDGSIAPIIPDGVLSGKFTVNAEGKQVYFSKGNLWYNGSSFQFEDEQYCFRHYHGINKDQAYLNGGSVTTTPENTVGSFFWSKSASVACGKFYSDATAAQTDIFFTNATETSAKPDFSVNVGGKLWTGVWRTLSKNEWEYLITNNKTAWATINNVKGRIIFCDGYLGDKKAQFTEIPEGCAFLPAAGNRSDSGAEEPGNYAGYWSSSAKEDYGAFNFVFDHDGFDPASLEDRKFGSTIRLVTDCK